MIEHSATPGVEYTLYRPDAGAERTIVFYPGMACNRFGHPVDKEPKHAVADLIALAACTYNIIFPEINIPDSLGDMAPIEGQTIDTQNQKVLEVLSDTGKKVELGPVTYVAQSLGCLAVAQLAEYDDAANTERAIFWGPPTLEGAEHREMLISKFRHKPETVVDEEGNGQLQLGNGRLMHVSAEYWQSIDENSLRAHYEAMIRHYESVTALCASKDNFYPNNKQYLSDYTPAVQRLEIEGMSHIFRPDSMRVALRRIMDTIL